MSEDTQMATAQVSLEAEFDDQNFGHVSVESDTHSSSDTTNSQADEPTGIDAGPRGGLPAEISNETFDRLLDEMGPGELNELTTRIANGSIKIVEASPSATAPTESHHAPPAQAIADDPAESHSPTRARIRVESEEDRLAVQYMKENPGVGLRAALAHVAKNTETVADDFEDPPPVPVTPPGNTSIPQSLPDDIPAASLDEAEAMILDLEEKWIEADEVYDDPLKNSIRRQILALQKAKPQIAAYEQRQQADAQRAYDQAFNKAQAEAAAVYPDLRAEQWETTELGKVIVAIDNEMRTVDPDLWSDPSKMVAIAKMAARRLGIAPGDSLEPTSPSGRPLTTAPVTPPRNPSATGVQSSPTARTAPPQQAGSRAAEEIEQIQDANQMRAFLARLGVR